MAQTLASRPCGEGGVVVEGDGRAQARVEPAEHGHHHRDRLGGRLAGKPGGEDEAGLALLEHQHRPGPLADQQVALPVPGLAAFFDGLGPVVDGAPLGDDAARLPSPTASPLGAPARQELPELLALLPGAMDEGVDRLERNGAQPTLLAALEPAGDLLGRPTLQKTLADEAAELGVTLHDRRPLAALEVASLGVDRQVAALGQRVAPQLTADGRGRPAELSRDRPQAQPLGLQHGQPLSFLQTKMRPARHRPIPDFGCRPGRYHNAPGCCASRQTPPWPFGAAITSTSRPDRAGRPSGRASRPRRRPRRRRASPGGCGGRAGWGRPGLGEHAQQAQGRSDRSDAVVGQRALDGAA
jgi:hypothetical protein